MRTKKQTVKVKKILKEIHKNGNCYIELVDGRSVVITPTADSYEILFFRRLNEVAHPYEHKGIVLYRTLTKTCAESELKEKLQTAFLDTKYKIAVL